MSCLVNAAGGYTPPRLPLPPPIHLNIDDKMACFIINMDSSAHGLRPTNLKCDSEKKSNPPHPPRADRSQENKLVRGDEHGET